jgi:hypothetical protein
MNTPALPATPADLVPGGVPAYAPPAPPTAAAWVRGLALGAATGPIRRSDVWREARPPLAAVAEEAGRRWRIVAVPAAWAAYLLLAPVAVVRHLDLARTPRPPLEQVWADARGFAPAAVYAAVVAGPALYAAWLAARPARTLVAAVVAAVLLLP